MAERRSSVILFVVLCAVFLPLELSAKRAVPQPVKPLLGDAYKIEAAGDGSYGKVKIAKHCKCPPKIFTIYKISYQKSLESDVQNLHITKLEIHKDLLLVKTEKGGIFSCNITTGKVKLLKLPQGYKQVKTNNPAIKLEVKRHERR